MSVAVQTDPDYPENEKNNTSEVTLTIYTTAQNWINKQENKGLKLALIVLFGCIVAMFWYFRAQVREFQQMSQPNSQTSNQGSKGRNIPGMVIAEELDNGFVKIGKIFFRPDELLGKGCDGTFVYK